ncbi:amidohydrolase family protein [Rhodobacterales bacterium]|nr:amidohydrolase family protein [Rhodobacterales bacterium]
MFRFDCHAHVYERVIPTGSVRYVPDHPAPLATWRKKINETGLTGGVIVQVSFLGTDNSQLLDALSQVDENRFAGVAVTDLDVTEADLERLRQGRVRGLRWNLVGDAPLPDLDSGQVRQLAGRLQDLGMHIEIQLESPRLAGWLQPLSRLGVPVVIDHVGLPVSADAGREPWLEALSDLADRSSFFVKLSAPYRGVADPSGHIAILHRLLGDGRFVWGSDWPHTRHEERATYDGLLSLGEVYDDATAASFLYGINCDASS